MNLKTLFRSTKIDLHAISDTRCVSIIYNSPRLAKKLNTYLQTYPIDTKFDQVDEPRFVFNTKDLESVCIRLGINSINILKEIEANG